MSDYLGRMAARSLGRLTSLRPRLRSRFESNRPSPLISGEHEGAFEVDQVFESEAPRPAMDRVHGGDPLSSRERRLSRSQHVPATTATGQVAVPSLPVGGPGAPHMEEDRAQSGALAEKAVDLLTPSSIQRSGFRSTAEEVAGRPTSSKTVASGEPDPTVAVAAASKPSLRSRSELLLSPARRVSALLSPRTGPGRVAPPPRGSAAQPASGSDSRSEPTIKVSIGRIEIQAPTVPAATAAKQRRPSPVQTLDAYLERRKGPPR
jgi:hypothetical protein